MAAMAGLRTRPLVDGRIKVTSRGSDGFIGTFRNETEAKAAIREFIGQNARDLDGQFVIPSIGTPLSQAPLSPQAQLNPIEKLDILLRKGVSGVQFGISVATPIGRWSQAGERLGKGPLHSLVVDPTQAAKRLYGTALTALRPRLKSLFGGKEKGFQEAARQMQREQLEPKIGSPEQRQFVTRWNEARTKNELTAPGAFLEGGIDAENIAVADKFSELGLADDIFLMMRANALIDDYLFSNQNTLSNVLPNMKNAVREGKLPEETLDWIENLARATGEEVDPADVMKTMGLTAEQQEGMNILRDIIDRREFNIPAIYRYATAPKLKRGFKDGKEQYAANMGMSPEAVALAGERRSFLIETFKGDEVLADQVLGAQLPVFREAMEAGFMPGKQFGETASPAMARWAVPLQHMVVGNEILGRRVLSGLLNPGELDPAISAIKHARNMLYREHVDPAIQKAMTVVNGLGEERTKKILINYLHELEGLPTESFKRLNAMIRSVARGFNVAVEDRVAEKWINTLNFMTYSSSIPFRVGLIARNSFQTMLIVPIMGGDAWYHGVKTALGFGTDGIARAEAAQAAMEAAVKGRALKLDVVPLHGGTEAIGGVSEGMFGNWRSDFAKVGFNVNELFTVGFTAYRKPDDIGRVVAFYAGKHRVNKALSTYHRSAKGDAALETLKRQGKVKTFDETIEAEFESLIRQDRFAEAEDLIGAELANKVHFLYGDASHPPGWGGVAGKLFGQFGTFPVQYLSQVTESLTRGTVKDRVEFLAVHSAINIGIITAGAKLFDADLESWAFLPSLTYTGGPYADILLNMITVMGGSDAERSLALRTLKMKLPSWNSPSSIFVPGSYFVDDLRRAFEEDDFIKGVGRAAGVRFLYDQPSASDEFFENVKAGFGWLNELNPLN